jgi:hypothetical protein
MPLHHPPRHRQRAPYAQRGRASGAHTEDTLSSGTTHLVMSPLEFIRRLAALVPRPRLHLVRFHGVLALEARPREGPAWRAEDATPGCVSTSFHPQGAKQATSLCLAFPNVPVNANTPSADYAEVPPPAAPAPLAGLGCSQNRREPF